MKKLFSLLFTAFLCCATTSAQEAPKAALEAAPQPAPKTATVDSVAALKLPDTLPTGYPIRFGVMEFSSSADLLLKDSTKLGRISTATSRRLLAVPTGASYLNVQLGRRNAQFCTVFVGKEGTGMSFPELQQAIRQGLVTHVVQCVIADASYKETKGEYYGVSVSETVYNLDLNVTVFDLSRKMTVLVDTYNAERVERKPFNRDHYEGDIFHALLKIACQKAADGLFAAIATPKDGSAPKIQPVK